jgi:tRNA 2-thiocytidine biosynthesis protein TtcA
MDQNLLVDLEKIKNITLNSNSFEFLARNEVEEFKNKLRKQMVQAISHYEMIREDDRIMVAVSGGKDSSIMLLLLEDIRRRSELNFSLHPVMLDQKQPGFSASAYLHWFDSIGLPIDIIAKDTYSIVKEKTSPGKSFCGLCSRLRRGILYNYAVEKGYHKIALGHHADDSVETLFLNMFYNGRMAAMPAKLKSDDKRNQVIRPLIFLREKSIQELAATLQIPVMPCNLCSNQERMQRQEIKKLLNNLESSNPLIPNNILAALKNIKPSQLLDKELFDFTNI